MSLGGFGEEGRGGLAQFEFGGSSSSVEVTEDAGERWAKRKQQQRLLASRVTDRRCCLQDRKMEMLHFRGSLSLVPLKPAPSIRARFYSKFPSCSCGVL